MDYIKKQQNLISAILRSDDTEEDKKESIEFLGNSLQAFPEYVNIVINEQISIPIWRATCEPEEYRERVTNIDKRRKIYHDNAISCMNTVNRFCDIYGEPTFFNVNTTDRHAVAEAVGEYVIDVYNNGINNTNQAVYEKGRAFDTAVMNHPSGGYKLNDIGSLVDLTKPSDPDFSL